MKTSSKAAEAVERGNYQRRVAFLLGAVSNLMATGGSRLFRQAFDLGLGEARLLYVLGYEADLTVGRASHIMGIDKAATSRALAVLERRELAKATVDATDARQRVIRLTPSGKRLRDRLIAVALDREKRVLSIFSAEEVEMLASLLQRLRIHIPTVRTPKPVPFANPAARAGKSRNQRAGAAGRRAKA
jgi:DNA-binding MarR family transcriptional regulator